MTVAIARSGSSGFGDLTNDPSFSSVLVDTAGDYILAAYMYRCNDAADISAPTWNSQTFTSIGSYDLPIGAAEHRFEAFYLKTSSSGTNTIVATNSQFKNTAAFYAVCTGVNGTTPLGTVQNQTIWSSYSNPALTITDASTGDLMIEILAAGGYDSGFGDTSTVTWTAQNSQTGVVNQHSTNTGSGTPNIILATKAGASGSQALGYNASTGSPGYVHIAFALKQTGGGGGAGAKLLSMINNQAGF